MSTSELTTANGYYEAVVVVDSLKESSGGDGTDVLIGVEGLMFGHTGSGEHDGLIKYLTIIMAVVLLEWVEQP